METEEEKKDFVDFLKSLVRYCFSMGSTTTIKFYIYNIIKVLANKGKVEPSYVFYVTPDLFTHLGRLQNAFALLAFHLDSGEPIPVKYTIDKIVNLRDEDILDEDWDVEHLNDICNSIGNLVVLDLSKRYNYLTEKYSYYLLSKSKYVRSIFHSPTFTFEDWKERNQHLKQVLADFFSIPKDYDEQT